MKSAKKRMFRNKTNAMSEYVCIFRAFRKRVSGRWKISGLLFKISGSDFEIRATNFFFAPMQVKIAENQFSIFGHEKRQFQR